MLHCKGEHALSSKYKKIDNIKFVLNLEGKNDMVNVNSALNEGFTAFLHQRQNSCIIALVWHKHDKRRG